jgi:hypothetical protein
MGYHMTLYCEIFNHLSSTQVAENLAQLMYSVLMTGYMFRNAQCRLELQQSLEQIALPESKEEKVTSYIVDICF